MLVVDETHFAARAPEYGEVLRKKDNDIDSDESDDYSISKDVVCKYINAKYWLHLTATPDITQSHREPQRVTPDTIRQHQRAANKKIHKIIKKCLTPYLSCVTMTLSVSDRH